jgi:hypothetical protein
MRSQQNPAFCRGNKADGRLSTDTRAQDSNFVLEKRTEREKKEERSPYQPEEKRKQREWSSAYNVILIVECGDSLARKNQVHKFLTAVTIA